MRDTLSCEETFNGLSAYDFLMEYGYLPQHKGIVADQKIVQNALEEWPEEDLHAHSWGAVLCENDQ